MRRILIVESSDDFRGALLHAFQKEYAVAACADGETALAMLRDDPPDILIMDLMLPGKDGLLVLEEGQALLPPIILCTSTIVPEYAAQKLKDLGVGYVILKPCAVRAVAARIADMVRVHQASAESPPDPQSIIAKHLRDLGIPAHLDGFLQLRVGIPLFAQDPAQRVYKELYVSVAALCGFSSKDQVERSIRDAIQAGWDNGDRALWKVYFPRAKKAPSNKKFIARLAQELENTPAD